MQYKTKVVIRNRRKEQHRQKDDRKGQNANGKNMMTKYWDIQNVKGKFNITCEVKQKKMQHYSFSRIKFSILTLFPTVSILNKKDDREGRKAEN